MKKFIASALIGGAAAAGIMTAGAGTAEAKVDNGTYRYCNQTISGVKLPVPHCSRLVIRNGYIKFGQGNDARITHTRTGGTYRYLGQKFVLRETRNGYVGSTVGLRPGNTFTLERLTR